MSKFYFTFGSGHHDTHGRSLGSYYVVIEAEDELAARREMWSHFGPKWASSYSAEGFAGQAEQYGLQEIWIGGVDLCCGVEQKDYLALKAELDTLKEKMAAIGREFES